MQNFLYSSCRGFSAPGVDEEEEKVAETKVGMILHKKHMHLRAYAYDYFPY